MSLLFNNWLEEGYYEDDGYGLTQVTDPQRIRELQREGCLYHNDGMATTKVHEEDELF